MKILDIIIKKKSDAKSLSRRVGDFGENAATKYLSKNGYKILERNYVARGKEIDIIAQNKEFIVFCEVKSRKTNENFIKKYGRPRDAVNKEKQLHISSAARYYLSKNKITKRIRFDVIEVYLENQKENKIKDIIHTKDAFRV